MGKKLTYTPNSKIKSALRSLFLRSREHGNAMKSSGYRCQRCGVKKSTAKGKEVKVEVHHREQVTNWPEMYDAIRKHLLNESEFEVLCECCHDKEHSESENCNKEATG